jgi:hypothetical protein
VAEKAAHLMVAGKQRKRGINPHLNNPLQGHVPSDLNLPLGPTSQRFSPPSHSVMVWRPNLSTHRTLGDISDPNYSTGLSENVIFRQRLKGNEGNGYM